MKSMGYWILRFFCFLYLTVQACLTDFFNTGLQKKCKSIPLSDDPTYLQTHSCFKYHLLKSNYYPQFNESACSVASVAIVLNAVRQMQSVSDSRHRITQLELLELADWDEWKARVDKNGYQGRRGLPIEKLGTAVAKSFNNYGLSLSDLEVVPISNNSSAREQLKHKLIERLNEFETDKAGFLIAHFNQGLFVDSLHIPHISPVAAYDREHKKVLLLDVDPDQSDFYWVDVDTFFDGLAYKYSWFIRKAGYDGGGYIQLSL